MRTKTRVRTARGSAWYTVKHGSCTSRTNGRWSLESEASLRVPVLPAVLGWNNNSRFLIPPRPHLPHCHCAEHIWRWERWGRTPSFSQGRLVTVIRVLAKPHSWAERNFSHERWIIPHLRQLQKAAGCELCSLEILLIVKLLFHLVRKLNPPSSQWIAISLKEWPWISTSF